MRSKSMLGISLLALTVTSVCWGWQTGPTGQQPGAPPPYYGTPSPDGQYVGAPQYGVGTASPPQAYQGQPAPGESAAGQAGYPYPPSDNPFFDVTMTRNFLSNSMDWLMGLPSNVFDRFSNYVDGAFFPQAPATQGGRPLQPEAAGPGQWQQPVARPPLPPASPYERETR